ncbi:hypothetical protein ScalyP_jg9522 [Parmales sp. scaly parma]|nr:hypothetical protein ScalyP_jg9522 [Parmales sp. scaly parma]
MDASAEGMDDLYVFAKEKLAVGNKVYVGLSGFSKKSTPQSEIDNDENRLMKEGRMQKKVAQKYLVLSPFDGEPGHNRARLGESWLIRQLGLDRLINERHGGAGRPPIFDEIGAVFVLVGE